MDKLRNLSTVLFVFALLCFSLVYAQQDPDPHRFDNQITQFQQWDSKNSLPEKFVLFIGSSSIRMWKTAEAFPDYNVVNRGFGGAHISDMLFYIEDIVLKHKSPECIVFYCGDNDISAKKSPERVYENYVQFVRQVHQKFPNVPFIYIPAKPSLNRWELWENMKLLNNKVRTLSDSSPLLYYAEIEPPMLGTNGKPKADLFIEDGLHLSDKGYKIWTRIVNNILLKICKR